MILAALGRVGLGIGWVETLSGLVSQRSGMDWLVPSEV